MSANSRKHGTLAMRRRGECRVDPCAACKEAGARYSRRNSKMRELGMVQLVDAEPARLRVKQLLADGMTVRQLEAATGVHDTAIRVLVGDFPNRKQSVRIRPATAAALLAVRFDPLTPRGDATVAAIGTRRRLQALQAIGYPGQYLAVRLGAGPNSMLQVARRDRVRAATARAVAALYAELENTPGPSSRTARAARGRGWLPPVWWDEDSIDDPQAVPAGVRIYREHGWPVLLDDATAPRAKRIALMLRSSRQRPGLSRQQIAQRLGVPIRYVNRDIREGRTR